MFDIEKIKSIPEIPTTIDKIIGVNITTIADETKGFNHRKLGENHSFNGGVSAQGHCNVFHIRSFTPRIPDLFSLSTSQPIGFSR